MDAPIPLRQPIPQKSPLPSGQRFNRENEHLSPPKKSSNQQFNLEPKTREQAKRCLSPYSFKRWVRKHTPSNWYSAPGETSTSSTVAQLMHGAPGGVAPSSIALNNPVMGLQHWNFASLGYVPIQGPNGAIFANSSAHDRRPNHYLVVQNIPLNFTKSAFLDFFHEKLSSIDIPSSQFEQDCTIYKSGRPFIFMKFEYPETIQKLLSLDGILFIGHSLFLRRPKDFTKYGGALDYDLDGRPTDASPIAYQVGALSTIVPNNDEKMIIENIPLDWGEDKVRDTLIKIGALKSFCLIREWNSGLSTGSCVCSFQSPESKKSCINILHKTPPVLDAQDSNTTFLVHMYKDYTPKLVDDMSLLDIRLRRVPEVGRTLKPLPLSEEEIQDILSGPLATIAPQVNIIAKSMRPLPPLFRIESISTPVLVLMNMVDENKLLNEDEFQDLSHAVQIQCSQYGKVVNLLIPRPIQTKQPTILGGGYVAPEVHVPGLGKIFVQFDTVSSALKAQKALGLLTFDGRQILCSFYPLDKFEKNEIV